LRQRYGSNALHVPNGLYPAQFTPANMSDQIALQQRYQLPPRYLLYFGNLATRSHGVDLLLRAFAQSTTQLPLVIAGDGHERATLQQLAVQLGIARRCVWLGQIAPSDIPALLAQAHVSIDPVRTTIAAAARFPLKKLLALTVPLLAVAMVLLVAVKVPGIGVSVNGARRWIGFRARAYPHRHPRCFKLPCSRVSRFESADCPRSAPQQLKILRCSR
jgi:glycosyltransferase involved in cell wall biosynthesis